MLLGLARKAPWARTAYEQYNLGDPDVISFTSVVCIGEILAIGKKRMGPEEEDHPRNHARAIA